MPIRGLMLPTREIGPRLSDKSKAGGLNRLRSRLCGRAVSNGRSEWAQACWQTMRRDSCDCWVLLFAWALPRWTCYGRN